MPSTDLSTCYSRTHPGKPNAFRVSKKQHTHFR